MQLPMVEAMQIIHDVLWLQAVTNKNTFCVLWCRFASGVIYFGLSLSTSTLAGDIYINFLLSGAVEAPAYAMTVVVLQK